MYRNLNAYDKIAQRYGLNPFDVPKIMTPPQITAINLMMKEENLYEKEQMKPKGGKK